MASQIIAFFSSDARDLYKADVFRTLALPDKFAIQFRYKSKYIHEGLKDKLNLLKDRQGVIFYASGNDMSVDADDREITFHSVREVVIKDVFHDKAVDLIKFTLELNDFIDCKPLDTVSKQLLPPNAIVSEIDIELQSNANWSNRVNAIHPKLFDALYFRIGAVSQNGNSLEPRYNEFDKASFYELNDESEYQIQFSFMDLSAGKYNLDVQSSSELIDLAIPSDYSIGAKSNTAIFNLFTYTLTTQDVISYSRITSSNGSIANLTIELRWKITRSIGKLVIFGLISAAAGLGVILARLATSNFETFSPSPVNYVIGVVSLIVIGISATSFYLVFNKK